jgi:hypothetical protein
MKRFIFWDVAPCNPLKVNQYFTSILHSGFLLSLIFSPYFVHTGFLLSLFFSPEDGGDMFLRNIG